jgi:hypothetical protein
MPATMSPIFYRFTLLASLMAFSCLSSVVSGNSTGAFRRRLTTSPTVYKWDLILDTYKADGSIVDGDTSNKVCASLWSIVSEDDYKNRCPGTKVQVGCVYYCREVEKCNQGKRDTI